MSKFARVMSLVALLAVAVQVMHGPGDGRAPRSVAPAASTPLRPRPSPPQADAADIDRQDRVGALHARREALAFDQRPLLAVLPLDLAGVRIEIAGLAADDATTIILIDPGTRERAYARALLKRTFRALGDEGNAYEVRWAQ